MRAQPWNASARLSPALKRWLQPHPLLQSAVVSGFVISIGSRAHEITASRRLHPLGRTTPHNTWSNRCRTRGFGLGSPLYVMAPDPSRSLGVTGRDQHVQSSPTSVQTNSKQCRCRLAASFRPHRATRLSKLASLPFTLPPATTPTRRESVHTHSPAETMLDLRLTRRFPDAHPVVGTH